MLEQKAEEHTLTISDDIYIDDGNVILHVIEDNETMRYRVHKSILARSSEFFDDLFKVPQPQDESLAGETIDGCPTINLNGDLISDWNIILKALYNPFFNIPQLSIQKIIAMLRIGKKYLFHNFLDEAQARLRQNYPSTLQEFWAAVPSPSIEENSTEKVIEVVHEGIIPDDVLPALYYDYLRFLNKFDSQDTQDQIMISDRLKLRLLVGHRRLLIAQAKHTFGWLSTGSFPQCQDKPSCKDAYRILQHSLDTPGDAGSKPLTPFSRFLTVCPKNARFCPNCKSCLTKRLKEGAEQVWNMLPSCFGLGEWDDLFEQEEEQGSDVDEEGNVEGTSS
ncbi:hypothetical protein M378DRAFT_532041 [Amanita muscaria Koide BX008]|uniref:BTB domain-containing protein n=1 Tax=Amanita muscaria (strain Koide BX008) TaxID=946122 RepID=A0A0C2WJB0_AMAMK|nr:hypothetical protein M378DRAFT_532041 [Amanita muscaria Koide BX008]